MTDDELIKLFRQVRIAQKEFFKTRRGDVLDKSKRLEKLVDQEFERRDEKQRKLFGVM